jgi:hypothetical protein
MQFKGVNKASLFTTNVVGFKYITRNKFGGYNKFYWDSSTKEIVNLEFFC